MVYAMKIIFIKHIYVKKVFSGIYILYIFCDLQMFDKFVMRNHNIILNIEIGYNI